MAPTRNSFTTYRGNVAWTNPLLTGRFCPRFWAQTPHFPGQTWKRLSPFKRLKTVIIPKSITYIGKGSFLQCSALKNINLPDSITYIGKNSFQQCSALQNINLPDSLASIELLTFAFCSSLSSITVPDSVTQIKGAAFAHCPSLKSITISDAALNNPNYGMHDSLYRDPFVHCTELIAIAQTLNMNVKQYLLHLNRIRLRVWVLICLKRINDKRISDNVESNKRRKLGDGSSSSSSSSSCSDVMLRRSARLSGISSSVSSQQPQRLSLNGVLAEEKITAFELWMEIAMFL